MRLMSVAQTLLQGHKVKSDFLFSKNLVSCIDACSNLCRDHPKLVFTHDERLPSVIKCDQDMFLLTIQTLTEFALRYTSVSGASNPDTKIIINSIFDGVVN